MIKSSGIFSLISANISQLVKRLLETFSFYDVLLKEHVILQMNENDIKSLPELTLRDLENSCKNLERKGLLKRVKKGPDIGWIRIFPPKNFWQKSYRFLRSFI